MSVGMSIWTEICAENDSEARQKNEIHRHFPFRARETDNKLIKSYEIKTGKITQIGD